MNAMIKLSPLNLHGLLSQYHELKEDSVCGHGRVEEVVMYRCPVCRELHDWDTDAEECCDGKSTAGNANTDCPVCGKEYATHRDASDCCLWKDIDALRRWEIADAVEAGSDWPTELGVVR